MSKRTYVRIISLILALIMVLPIVISCGDNKKGPSASTGGNTLSQNKRDNLPELDFDSEVVNFLTHGDALYDRDATVDDASSSDIVDVAVWERQQVVEQRLNIIIANQRIGSSQYEPTVVPDEFRKDVLAGTSNYDIGVSPMSYTIQFATEGLFYDMNKLPYIELSQSYYTQGLNNEAIMAGKLFGIVGDATLSYISYMSCVFFNRTMAEERKIEDLYQLVLDGKWTLEKQINLSKDVYSDNNGDGKKDIGDTFGYIAMDNIAGDPFGSAFDLPIMKRNAAGELKFAVNTDKASAALTSLNRWLWQTEGAYLVSASALGKTSVETVVLTFQMFANDQTLFLPTALSTCEDASVRNMESLYGILPHPKYDEAQQQHGTFVSDLIGMYFVSASAPQSRLELIGATVECMFSESENAKHKLFEDALKVKYQSTEKTGRMLDIMADNVVVDPAHIYLYISGCGVYLGDLLAKKTNVVAGFWKMHQTSVMNRMIKFETEIKNLKD